MKRTLMGHLAGLALAAYGLFGLVFVVVYGGLLVALGHTDGLTRYPGAERLAAAGVRLERLPHGHIVNQSAAYQTADALPQVLGWYARHLGLSHDGPHGSDCITMQRVDARLYLEHWLSVTLCARPIDTLIFVNRSLAVRW